MYNPLHTSSSCISFDLQCNLIQTPEFSVNVRVQAKVFSALGTHLYLHDAPENAHDFLSRQRGPAGRAARSSARLSN